MTRAYTYRMRLFLILMVSALFLSASSSPPKKMPSKAMRQLDSLVVKCNIGGGCSSVNRDPCRIECQECAENDDRIRWQVLLSEKEVCDKLP